MRRRTLTGLAFLVLTTSAHAHDVRWADGSPFAHDCAAAFFNDAGVRNVSVTLPEVYDCKGATWPDIPASCVTDEPTITAGAN